MNQIIAAHLFGVAPKPQPVVQQAPETRLRLTLLGVMASSRDDKARAVIASDAAADHSYSIGDRINGTDAKLYAIEKDRVIIERGKRLEKLSLERPDLASAPSSPERRPARARRAPQPSQTTEKSRPDPRKEAERRARQARRRQALKPGTDGDRQQLSQPDTDGDRQPDMPDTDGDRQPDMPGTDGDRQPDMPRIPF